MFRDRVDIDQATSGFTNVADMLASATDNGSGNAVIDLGGGAASITFQHVSAATLQAHANDFHLVA